jgi:hypothetical protein
MALDPALTAALVRMESVEQAARIVAVAGLCGASPGLLRTDAAALASLQRAHEFPRESNPRPS